MPKRTLALIVVLILITVGLVWLSVYTQPQPKTQVVQKQTLKLPPAVTTIALSSTPDFAATSSSYSLDVKISSGENKVTAVQLEMSYDPKAINVTDILPGTFLNNPIVLLKKIDEQNGRVSYAVAIKPGDEIISGNGTIAKLVFKPVLGSKLATTEINFLPTTEVAAAGNAKSSLKSALGTTINLSTLGQQPTPTTTSDGE